MHGENALAEEEAPEAVYELTPIDLDAVPARHPVAVFARRYQDMTEGHFIPDEKKLLADNTVLTVSGWLDHIEPVSLGGHVDFYILSPDESLSSIDEAYQRGTWMNESMDEGFTAARYHEAVSAAIQGSRAVLCRHARGPSCCNTGACFRCLQKTMRGCVWRSSRRKPSSN